MKHYIIFSALLVLLSGCHPSSNQPSALLETSALQSSSGLIATPDRGSATSSGSQVPLINL